MPRIYQLVYGAAENINKREECLGPEGRMYHLEDILACRHQFDKSSRSVSIKRPECIKNSPLDEGRKLRGTPKRCGSRQDGLMTQIPEIGGL